MGAQLVPPSAFNVNVTENAINSHLTFHRHAPLHLFQAYQPELINGLVNCQKMYLHPF